MHSLFCDLVPLYDHSAKRWTDPAYFASLLIALAFSRNVGSRGPQLTCAATPLMSSLNIRHNCHVEHPLLRLSEACVSCRTDFVTFASMTVLQTPSQSQSTLHPPTLCLERHECLLSAGTGGAPTKCIVLLGTQHIICTVHARNSLGHSLERITGTLLLTLVVDFLSNEALCLTSTKAWTGKIYDIIRIEIVPYRGVPGTNRVHDNGV